MLARRSIRTYITYITHAVYVCIYIYRDIHIETLSHPVHTSKRMVSISLFAAKLLICSDFHLYRHLFRAPCTAHDGRREPRRPSHAAQLAVLVRLGIHRHLREGTDVARATMIFERGIATPGQNKKAGKSSKKYRRRIESVYISVFSLTSTSSIYKRDKVFSTRVEW